MNTASGNTKTAATFIWMECPLSYQIPPASIHSFKYPATAKLYHGRNTSRARRFPRSIVGIALRKMDVLNAAHKLDDLRSLPGNRFREKKETMLPENRIPNGLTKSSVQKTRLVLDPFLYDCEKKPYLFMPTVKT